MSEAISKRFAGSIQDFFGLNKGFFRAQVFRTPFHGHRRDIVLCNGVHLGLEVLSLLARLSS